MMSFCLFVFWVFCLFVCFFEVVGVVDRTPPRMKTGSRSQHCQTWCLTVGCCLPPLRISIIRSGCFERVGVCMHGRWGKCFFVCVPYGCPRLRGCSLKLCVSRALWTCSVGQRQYLGRLAAGVAAAAKLRPGPPKPLPCLPPF